MTKSRVLSRYIPGVSQPITWQTKGDPYAATTEETARSKTKANPE